MRPSAYLVFLLVVATALLSRYGPTGLTVIATLAVSALAAIPLYFGTRNRSAKPSTSERVLATAWLWFRRIVGLSGGVFFLAGAGYLALSEAAARDVSHRWLGAVFLALLGMSLLYFGVVGQGTRRFDWRDDVQLHVQNKRRYRWWF